MAEPFIPGGKPVALDAWGLRAGYGDRTVLDGIDLSLRGGEILGLLGGNGSGKSTLLKLLTGQIPLRAGRVMIGDVDLRQDPKRAKAQLGFAVEPGDLPAMLTGRQYLELVASMRGLALDTAVDRDLVDRLRLGVALDCRIEILSFGTQAKLSILAALLGKAPLVILDESLNGLDPLAAWEVKTMIRDWAGSGRHAFIIATHIVEMIPALCSVALLLAEGRILHRWSPEALDALGRAPGEFETAVMRALRDTEAASRSLSG